MGQLLSAETPLLFAVGVLFGALLLCPGLAVGFWLGRKGALPYTPESLDQFHLVNLLHGLSKWTNGFANDVSQYRETLDGVWQRFGSDGEEAPIDNSAVVRMLAQIMDANEKLQGRLDTAENALQEQAEEISVYMSEARTDALTGLPNRRVFDDELARRMAEWRRHGVPISILLGDIDHFKRFNDRYGHLAGDAVLADVARVLRDTMRESDLVARIGGEEFAMILPYGPDQDPRQAAERARVAVARAVFRYEGRQLRVTISCGATQAVDGEDIVSLVRRADEALYAAKSAGRDSAHWHDGQTCQAITVAPQPVAAPSDDLGDVCDALHNRMLAVVAQEA